MRIRNKVGRKVIFFELIGRGRNHEEQAARQRRLTMVERVLVREKEWVEEHARGAGGINRRSLAPTDTIGKFQVLVGSTLVENWRSREPENHTRVKGLNFNVGFSSFHEQTLLYRAFKGFTIDGSVLASQLSPMLCLVVQHMGSIMENSTGFIEPILAGESVRRNSTTGCMANVVGKKKSNHHTTCLAWPRLDRSILFQSAIAKLPPLLYYVLFYIICATWIYIYSAYDAPDAIATSTAMRQRRIEVSIE
ncbi:hypothetical protein KQX54_020117 [Cotesia glomerata]|uniref:Uncharacterized protein n=1 Tax=Cotesia glomerata TaxID=32391 RepID=A0AAV7I4L1_COTGL|nr:hypothetical protein KQX54_020117 [Cotesia glomerata]